MGELLLLLGGVLNGEADVSVSSAVLGSGAVRLVVFCARLEGLFGMLGFAVRLTGGGTLVTADESGLAPGGFGLLARSVFGGSLFCSKTDMRASSAGVATRLSVRE